MASETRRERTVLASFSRSVTGSKDGPAATEFRQSRREAAAAERRRLLLFQPGPDSRVPELWRRREIDKRIDGALVAMAPTAETWIE